jgi:hypothetical protein
MKKSLILLTALLFASIAGTYAVYELYVKQRMKELAAHLEQERQLRTKIESLDEQFFGTEPPAVLEEWRRATQPWSDAVEQRIRFFTLGKFVEEVKIPQEVIPRFYYRDELPKRIQRLQDYALQKNVEVANVTCGVPAADSFRAGSDPSARVIANLLRDYDYCAALTRMLIDAGPASISPLSIWPEQETKIKSRGTIRERTTGIEMRIRMEPLVKFLESLVQSDRYFRVDRLRIANPNLNNSDPVLNLSMVITQTSFERDVQQTTGEQTGASKEETKDRLSALFGGNRIRDENDRRKYDEKSVPSAWQRFRKRWLPF